MSRVPKKTEAATLTGMSGTSKDLSPTDTSNHVVDLGSEEDAERALRRLKALLVTAGKETKVEEKNGKKTAKIKGKKKDKLKFDPKMFDVGL